MRIKVLQQPRNIHTDLTSSVAWNGSELFSCSDDKTIHRWDKNAEPVQQVATLDTAVTEIDFFPSRRTVTGPADALFVVGCTDGSFRLISRQGRVEKVVENAHTGAVTAIRWSFDGTLITAGEDGVIKVWSRKGMLRSTLLQTGKCIYSMTWSPNCDQILLTSGRNLIIKPLQPSSKKIEWLAHDGPVLKVDWNPVNNLIVSGGEDCRYKIWDPYGRLLYQCKPEDHHITSVAWCPDGELFAAGSYNTLRLCDKTGWSYSRERTNAGSLFHLAWTADGTQLAAGGGNGAVCFGTIVDRRVEWGGYIATLDDPNHIRVSDIHNDVVEDLEFRDLVVKMAMGYNHMIVTTNSQCHIYHTNKWSNPIPVDLKDTISLIVLAEKCFLLVDSTAGVQVYNYEGRIICSPKFKGLRSEFLNSQTVSLSSQHVAIIDRGDSKAIHLFELQTNKPIVLRHDQEISELALSQQAGALYPMVAIINKNNDLYLSPVEKQNFLKMASMVDTIMWEQTYNMLAAFSDGKFVLWYFPQTVFVQPDLLSKTAFSSDGSELGFQPRLVSFTKNKCMMRRTDGALIGLPVSPYHSMLHSYTERHDWQSALKLCRYVKDNTMWATLGVMALHMKELSGAELAFAAIDAVDKLNFVLSLKKSTTTEVRNAKMLAFTHQVGEAESLLLQAGLYYRAIKLNISLYRWERALELANKYSNGHIPTVMGYRQRYLDMWHKTETISKFRKLDADPQFQVDWTLIHELVAREKEAERRRG